MVVTLFSKIAYVKRRTLLEGQGKITVLGHITDKLAPMRWEKQSHVRDVVVVVCCCFSFPSLVFFLWFWFLVMLFVLHPLLICSSTFLPISLLLHHHLHYNLSHLVFHIFCCFVAGLVGFGIGCLVWLSLCCCWFLLFFCFCCCYVLLFCGCSCCFFVVVSCWFCCCCPITKGTTTGKKQCFWALFGEGCFRDKDAQQKIQCFPLLSSFLAFLSFLSFISCLSFLSFLPFFLWLFCVDPQVLLFCSNCMSYSVFLPSAVVAGVLTVGVAFFFFLLLMLFLCAVPLVFYCCPFVVVVVL